MNGVNQEKNGEIRSAIKNSITDARSTIQELAAGFSDTVKKLRFEESEGVFIQLVQNIRDLHCVIDFIIELGEGMKFFDGFGLAVDPMLSEDSAMKVFRQINSAIETKDWVLLSDLIEYELSPLLKKEDEWLGMLDTRLAESTA